MMSLITRVELFNRDYIFTRNNKFVDYEDEFKSKIEERTKFKRLFTAYSITDLSSHNKKFKKFKSVKEAKAQKKDLHFILKNFSNITSPNEETKISSSILKKPIMENSSLKNKFLIFNFQNPISSIDKYSALIREIIRQRKISCDIITKNFRVFSNKIKAKKQALIENINKIAIQKSIKIQSYYKMYKVKKEIYKIRKSLEITFFYYYNSFKQSNNALDDRNNLISLLHVNQNNKLRNNNKLYITNKHINKITPHIKLRVHREKSKDIEIDFNYSHTLDCYYILFKKSGPMKRKYKVNFIVDGNTIIDPRFEVDNDSSGNFYNIIESSMLKRKKTVASPTKSKRHNVMSGFWKNIFEIKSCEKNQNRTCSSVSDLSDQAACIEKLLNKINHGFEFKDERSAITPKSILKINKFSSQNCKKVIKRVSFNNRVEYSS